MNRLAAAACLVFFVSLCGSATGESAPDPSGTWNRGDGNAKVRIAPCGSNICATNVWIKDTSGGFFAEFYVVDADMPRAAVISEFLKSYVTGP